MEQDVLYERVGEFEMINWSDPLGVLLSFFSKPFGVSSSWLLVGDGVSQDFRWKLAVLSGTYCCDPVRESKVSSERRKSQITNKMLAFQRIFRTKNVRSISLAPFGAALFPNFYGLHFPYKIVYALNFEKSGLCFFLKTRVLMFLLHLLILLYEISSSFAYESRFERPFLNPQPQVTPTSSTTHACDELTPRHCSIYM